MKPLNLDNRPCNPVSSNCIIWQGPDISCINICNGDSVSEVVAALATELCTILDQTNVSNYDLACLGITTCGPKDFQALIQLLIDKICELQGITPTDTKVIGCPDCIVTVASCFVQGTQTTMQLLDYVQMIGEKICNLIDEIADLQAQIDNLDIRVTILENAPVPTFEIPSFTLGCSIGSLSIGTTQFINVTLQEFINNVWCQFFDTTGSTTDLISAVNAICIEDSDLQLTTGTPFSSNPNWIQSGSYDTVADAINNLWIAVCDVYNAVTPLNVTDTNTVNLTYTSGTLRADMQDTGWIPLLGFSYMSGASFKPQCRRIGNVIHFKGTIYVPIGTLNSGGGGTAEPVADPDDYNGIDSGYTFNTIQATSGSDPDACLLSGPSYVAWAVGQEALRLQFRRGNSVIPPGILGVGETLDASASVSGRVICERVARSTAIDDIAMTSVIGLSLSSAGALLVTSANFNDTFRGTTNCVGKTSLTRQLCTVAISGENIPEYYGTAPSQFNATAAGNYQPDIVGSAQTYAFNQDMSRADQLAGLSINISDIKAFVEDCSGNIPTFVNC
jgi:hypothetical protein